MCWQLARSDPNHRRPSEGCSRPRRGIRLDHCGDVLLILLSPKKSRWFDSGYRQTLEFVTELEVELLIFPSSMQVCGSSIPSPRLQSEDARTAK